MAYTNIPRDLSTVKSKVAFNLTKRQLLCFGAAAAIGIPTYLLARGAIGNSAAALVMIAIMLPLFFMGVYEKDGQPAEKILRNILRLKFYRHGERPYKTVNLFEILERRETRIDSETKSTRIPGKANAKDKKHK